jgi:hypothetical protein
MLIIPPTPSSFAAHSSFPRTIPLVPPTLHWDEGPGHSRCCVGSLVLIVKPLFQNSHSHTQTDLVEAPQFFLTWDELTCGGYSRSCPDSSSGSPSCSCWRRADLGILGRCWAADTESGSWRKLGSFFWIRDAKSEV